MEQAVCYAPGQFVGVNAAVETVEMDGVQVLRVVKNTRLDEFDINTYAKVLGADFHNGTIEVEVQGRLLPDAPDFARAFVGIVYRTDADEKEFESFYVRPTNGRRCTDPVRRQHGCQYFSYPGYTFAYFREFGITDFEAKLDIDVDEWIAIKAVVENERATFYVNDMETPALVVDTMKHGAGARGSLGIYVDTGTDAYVRNFRVSYAD